MAELLPLRALHYDLGRAGPLDELLAPPYDVVVDPGERAALLDRNPYNVVALDLPHGEPGGDRYLHAASLLERWQADGILVRDPEPALWVLEQAFTDPGGTQRVRRGVLGRVGVQPYGPGRIRPHELTHPGAREDRLKLTRATRTNLSPIFALHRGDAVGPLLAVAGEPWARATDAEGTRHALHRVTDPQAIAAAITVLDGEELLIADGHHRYETALAYAAEGGARDVLMLLVADQDPGLLVLPTHRLVLAGEPATLRRRLAEHLTVERVGDPTPPDPDPTARDPGPFVAGWVDRDGSWRLRAEHASPVPDTAVAEALVLRAAAGLTAEQIHRREGLAYARTQAEAVAAVAAGEAAGAVILRPTPIAQVRAIAAAGRTMPAKSTSFSPKAPAGLLFSPLDG